MGHISKELKEVTAKALEDAAYPVENKHYHIKMVKTGDSARPGWLMSKRTKAGFTREAILTALARIPAKEGRYCFSRSYFMYPGPKPDPKWGPVTP